LKNKSLVGLAEEGTIKKRGMKAPSNNNNLSTPTEDVIVNPRHPEDPDSNQCLLRA
jgi:hypothetical protein